MGYTILFSTLAMLVTGVAFSQSIDNPPTMPAGLTAFGYSKSVGEVLWERSTDDRGVVRGYEISRDGVVLGEFDALSYLDNSLRSGTSYLFGVTAIDNAGQRSETATATLTTQGGVLPEAPADLRAIAYSRHAAELFWARSSESGLRYEVSRDGQVLATTDGISFFDNELTGSWTYRYEVVALNKTGLRSVARAVFVKTPGDNKLPSAPAGLNALVYSRSAAELFWARPETVGLSYHISRDGQPLDTTDGISYFDDSLRGGREYSYEVVAVDSAGQTSPSSSVSLRTPGDQAEPPPVPGENPFPEADPNATTTLARTGYPAIRTVVDDLVSMAYLSLFYDIVIPVNAFLIDRFSESAITIDCPGGGSATGTASRFSYAFVLDQCVIEGRSLNGGLSMESEFVVFGLGGAQTMTVTFDDFLIETGESDSATFNGQSVRVDSTVGNIECGGRPRTSRNIDNQMDSVDIVIDGEQTSIASAAWKQLVETGFQRTDPDSSVPCATTEQFSFAGSSNVVSTLFTPEVAAQLEKQGKISRDEIASGSPSNARLAANFNDGSQFTVTLLSDSESKSQVDIVAEGVAVSFTETYRFQPREDVSAILSD